eukprot:TRINITY_DN3015_c1_g1_i2.p1 TRINITY_DN3015_c1_g1~~TRINITY_DN3015_c1_g1_i2.p1  ORF type:complete len:108 (+),score=0.35 TRINITY_DN3015_c1_g1_i2:207-530(+)
MSRVLYRALRKLDVDREVILEASMLSCRSTVMSAGFSALKRLNMASKNIDCKSSSVMYQKFKHQVTVETLNNLATGESLPVTPRHASKPYVPNYGGDGTTVGKETLM